MPKKIKTVEDHLQSIEYLLAGIILKRDLNIKQVAKIIGCCDTKLTEMCPERKIKKKLVRTIDSDLK
jgi:hypothetical protein